jgi:hypothetical protein
MARKRTVSVNGNSFAASGRKNVAMMRMHSFLNGWLANPVRRELGLVLRASMDVAGLC